MIHGLYVSAAGALVHDHRMDVHANNLANVNTNGFKRELAIFVDRNLPQYPMGRGPVSMEPVAAGVLLARTPLLFTQGPIETTHNPLHAAIDGEGFFAVQDREGNTSLTRAGAFRRGPGGMLVTEDGRYRVLDAGGAPIGIPPEVQSVQLLSDGTVSGDGVPIATVGRFTVARMQGLSPLGDGRFAPAAGDTPQPVPAPLVTGALEGSNVDLVREMVGSIESARQMEMNLRILRVQDELLGRTVRDLPRIA